MVITTVEPGELHADGRASALSAVALTRSRTSDRPVLRERGFGGRSDHHMITRRGG
jgi:hypothetical protein